MLYNELSIKLSAEKIYFDLGYYVIKSFSWVFMFDAVPINFKYQISSKEIYIFYAIQLPI